jgi:3',5'-cyclic AMP phosphodiesterase CpdA
MTFRLAHASDLHLTGADGDADKLDALFRSLKEHDVDHLVVTGDVTERGERAGFALLDQKRREHGYGPRRSTVLPGNHDVPGRTHFQRFFGDEFNSAHRSLHRCAIKLVTVDSTKVDPKLPDFAGNTPGYLDAHEWTHLECVLRGLARGSSSIIVALHHHVFVVPDGDNLQRLGRALGKIPGARARWGPLEHRQRFIALLAQHGVGLVLTGHSHPARARALKRGDTTVACHIGGATFEVEGYGIFDFDERRRRREDWISICLACNELSVVDCSDCDGEGQHDCDECDDDAEVECEDCEGEGTVGCPRCDGDDEGCRRCAGEGEVPCGTCDERGFVACDTCGGDGFLTCDSCDGDGDVACGCR